MVAWNVLNDDKETLPTKIRLWSTLDGVDVLNDGLWKKNVRMVMRLWALNGERRTLNGERRIKKLELNGETCSFNVDKDWWCL
jgi:hypothetical protein